MALVLNTNIASLNATRNLANTQAQQATTFQRLSTGLRINSAKDDAAGLYLAQAQTKDIRGLSMATRNANDGISMAQTAEGALDQIQQNLQRINELSIQSANGTYNNAAREGLQKEVDQLTQEINRIVETTEFNGEKLLSTDAKSFTMQIGFRNEEGARINTGMEGGLVAADKGDLFRVAGMDPNITFENRAMAQSVGELAARRALLADDVALTNAGSITYLGRSFEQMAASAGDSGTEMSRAIFEGVATLGKGESFTLDGMTLTRQAQDETDQFGQQLKIEFNGKETTVNSVWGATGAFDSAASVAPANMADLFGAEGNHLTNSLAPAANQFFGGDATTQAVQIDNTSTEDVTISIGDLAVFNSGELAELRFGESIEHKGWTFTRTDGTAAGQGTGLTISYLGGSQRTLDSVFNAKTGDNYGVGLDTANAGTADFLIPTATISDLVVNNQNIALESGGLGQLLNGDLNGTKVIDLTTQEAAQKAIEFTRGAIDTISELRATFGAIMNRFEAVISGNQIYSENLSASRSRIQDADFAQETANLSKNQVLQQAGISSLSQANASAQAILGLLG